MNSPLAGTYVCVEGPIGVGKTTLAELLKEQWSAEILYEIFDENPFLAKFYNDRGGFAFLTQMWFLQIRYHLLRKVRPGATPLVSDFFFTKDRIFAELNLRGDELDTYYAYYDLLSEHLPKPNLVIHLTAELDVLMKRILSRGRDYEKNMDARYIGELSRHYETFFASYDVAPVLRLDTTHLDLVHNMDHRALVLNRIEAALKQHMPTG